MKKVLLILIVYSQTLLAQKTKQYELMIKPAVFSITMVMIHDVVSPPVAARYYAYCMAGAYDIVAQNNAGIISPTSFINNYTSVKINNTKYDYHIAAVYCIYETGRLLLPSGYRIEDDEKKFIAELKKNNISQKLTDSSITIAKNVAMQIVAWAKTDAYNRLSTRLRYTPLKADSNWYPTPPSYLEAVEPNWRTVRPMLVDSCNQFKPIPPTPFSKDSGTAFYSLAKEVRDVSINPSQEHLNIASFWDCNPFAVTTSGHMMIGFKKISPGGHWMNITGIAANKAHLNFNQYIQVQTLVALTLMDAFISSWDEKYRSNRIRPETYINRYIDAKWQPLLQTPPFPEYTSGHSVISTAAARVLEYLLGNQFSYKDDSEEMFGMQSRSFSSFMQAANEAAISRLYGGIHFRDSIEKGQAEGKDLGNFVVDKLIKAGVKPLYK